MKTTILAASLALVLAAGCSGGDDEGATSTTVADASATADTSGPASTVTDETTPVTAADVATTVPVAVTVPPTSVDAVIEIENQPGEGTFEGALDDASFECEQTETGWSAAGSVTNSTETPVAYRIFISFVDDGGETMALLQAADDLTAIAPGEAREWSVAFESDVEGLTCVARVERRTT